MSKITMQPAPVPWYRRGWGMALIAILGILLLSLFAFGWYVWQLSQDIAAPRVSNATSAALIAQLQTPGPLTDAAGSNRPQLGPDEAPVTIVEFLDFTCPVCQAVYPTVREIAARHPNDVRVVARHFPVLSEQSQQLAIAAECAYQQEKYWHMHDQLFQTDTEQVAIATIAQQSGLNLNLFNRCLERPQTQSAVDNDLQAARALGARGTPTFVINGHRVDGGIPRDIFLDVVDALVAPSP